MLFCSEFNMPNWRVEPIDRIIGLWETWQKRGKSDVELEEWEEQYSGVDPLDKPEFHDLVNSGAAVSLEDARDIIRTEEAVLEHPGDAVELRNGLRERRRSRISALNS